MKNIQPHFQRAFIFVACIHGVLILVLLYFMRRPITPPLDHVTWINPGSFSSAPSSLTASAPSSPATLAASIEEKETAPSNIQEEEEKKEPVPTSPPKAPVIESKTDQNHAQEEKSTPLLPQNNSEIPLAAPTPQLTPDSKQIRKLAPEKIVQPHPKITPKPAPKPTSQEQTKPTPKSSQQATPKMAPKIPTKIAPKEKAHLNTSSANKESSSHEKNETKNRSSENNTHDDSPAKAAFLKSKNGKTNGSSGSHGESNDDVVNSGALGAYHELIHDRFYSQWEQPTTIPTEHKHDFVSTLQIIIQADGTISHFTLVKPSGNPVMDSSVLAAAGKVLKITPLPHGVGDSGNYVVNINFELE